VLPIIQQVALVRIAFHKPTCRYKSDQVPRNPFLASLRIVDDAASDASALSRQWLPHGARARGYAFNHLHGGL
jgi:hypothetical protein